LPLHTRRRVIVAVLNEILGLHDKPKAAVHPEHKLTGPKKKKKKKKKKNPFLQVDHEPQNIVLEMCHAPHCRS